MFRQIWIREADRNLQQILWRADEVQPIQIYRLNTVTYGTPPAPYLALRCMNELANQDKDFPEASLALKQDRYMDDVLSGAFTIDEAISLRKGLSEISYRGKFLLRKWRSNHNGVIADLPESTEDDNLLRLDKDGPIKTLGILWDAKVDILRYSIDLKPCKSITKREILSAISKIYDPLGLLGAVIIWAKIFMQQLWELKKDWDDLLPSDYQDRWINFMDTLKSIEKIRIPRNVNPNNSSQKFILVGFGDASEKAFGACLYCLSRNSDGALQSILICAKSKVAPLKTISLPRLELNAALLLARLHGTALQSFMEKIQSSYLFSDSTIVLSWIASSPNIRKTYVANRVTKVQNKSKNAKWMHVSSKDNPADLLSRGIAAEDLEHNELWWKGPTWLTSANWPTQTQIEFDTTEMKKSPISAAATSTRKLEVLYKYSSYDKLVRIIAYCRKFIAILRRRNDSRLLSVEDLEISERIILQLIQQEHFSAEISALKAKKPLPTGSKLSALFPFLDEWGIVRVGGRIKNAEIQDSQKHPIVLPAGSHITQMIIRKEHIRLHHCGPNQLLYSVRQAYWPLAGRREVHKVFRACLKCWRTRPQPIEYVMADLPADRVRIGRRAFVNTGIDYAGPIQVRESRRRGRVHITKGWIAVFVCMATKAVHLELVTELTTEAMLKALSRFLNRRGNCKKIFSDNGTNFIGAANHLQEVYNFTKEKQPELNDYFLGKKIEWVFNPPRASHCGGLWEAAVKIAKQHLFKLTRGLTQTFEEYYTLLVEIEAIMNSRPLSPIPSDPTALSVLTPSHLLIGDVITQPPEYDLLQTPDNRLNRWQHLQKIRQQFWSRWQSEYQRRGKWRTANATIKVGDLVILKEDNTPPLFWPMGRIIEVFPGPDGIIRTVAIKTEKSEFKRNVRCVCPLPIEDQS